jgi:predicted ATP-dependent endonuclease of OLD family
MNINIRKIKIKNYRGINETTVDLPKKGVLFGDFLMGKTSIFEAISLALGVNYWISDLTIDSFYRGMINFEEFVESESIAIRLTLSGFENKLEFEQIFGKASLSSLGTWDENNKELSFDQIQNRELAVDVIFMAQMKGDQVLHRRFLATAQSEETYDGTEPDCKVNVGELIGFFYVPLRTSNNRKWLEKHLHEATYEVDQWKNRAKDYLNVFQESHDAMMSFMDQLDQKRKGNTNEKELSIQVAEFVGGQIKKVSQPFMKSDANAYASPKDILHSFRSLVDNSSFKQLLQIIGANSYNIQGVCILSGLIEQILDRIEKNLPCLLLIDEPEAFFEESFFWKRLVHLVNETPNIKIIIATHARDIVDLFPTDKRVYIHNVFGNVAVIDEVLFNGLYQ